MSEAWETSKENVLPVKRGRSAKGLSDALLAPVDESETSSVIAAFESELKGAPATGADMLDIYVRYFKWVRDKFPANAARAMQVLEQATAQLAHNKGCKNDIRFVKLWIEYADMVRAPGDIFSYMQANKIGETVALFWAGWAFVAEKHENFSLADQIFQKGIKKGAEPKDMLAKRYQQYQRRMARRFLNSMQGDGAGDAAATGNAAGAGAGSGSAASRSDENAPTGRNNARIGRSRSALGQLAGSERISTSSSRPAAPVPAPPPAAATAGSKVPRSKGNGGSTFSIYSEPDGDEEAAPPAPQAARGGRGGKKAVGGGVALEDCGSEGWRVLGSEAGRRKENDGLVSKFTDGGVVAARPAPPAGSTLDVFVDEEFQDQERDLQEVEGQRQQAEPKKGVLSIRRALEQAATAGSEDGVCVDQILKNPLARHPTAPPKATVAAATASKPASSGSAAAPAPKQALAAKSSQKTQATTLAHTSSSGSFAIFSDEAPTPAAPAAAPVARKSSKPAAVKKTPEPAGGAFAIFCDDEPETARAAAPAVKTPAPTTKTVTQETRAAVVTTTPGHQAGDVITCSDVMGSGGCTHSLSRAHNRSRNLSTASANSSVGGATATINTKLAMMDIEMMFCDDEPEAVAPAPAVVAAPVTAAADTTADISEVQRLLRNLEHEQEQDSRSDAAVAATPAAAMPATDRKTDRRPPSQHTAPRTQARPAPQPDKLLFTCGGLVSDIKRVGEHGRDSGAFDYHQHYVGDGALHTSSRRRARGDSDSHDFGHCVASPTITFTSTVIPPTGAAAASAPVPTTSSSSSSGGVLIYQDSPQAPAPGPVSQRSKRPKKLNDCWAGIDDLLADEPEPAPASAPAEKHGPAAAFAVYRDGDGGPDAACAREAVAGARRCVGEAEESDDDESLCLNDLLKAAEN